MKQRREQNRDYSLLIERLLEPYNGWKQSEDRFRSSCPFHLGDSHTAFSVYRDGRFRCFKCDASGDIVALVAKIDRLTLRAAREYVEHAPVPRMTSERLQERLGRKKEEYSTLKESAIAAFRNNCPQYLVERGFSEASLKRFSIGYDTSTAKIILPMRDVRGKIVGLTQRIDFDDDQGQYAKYLHDNFEKSKHLYGLHLYKDNPLELYLVEGQLDAVRMWQLGHRAVAIMGSEISEAQVELLVEHAKAWRLVLAFDNDEAGEKATRTAVQKLMGTRFGQGLMEAVYPGKDPGELTELSTIRLIPWYKGCTLVGKRRLTLEESFSRSQEAAQFKKGKKN